MLDGQTIVNNIWTSLGPLVVFIVLVYVTFKFFLGQNRNIVGGIFSLIGAAVMLFFAINPTMFHAIGATIGGWISAG